MPRVVSRLYSFYLFTIYALLAGLEIARLIKKFSIDIVLERETSFGAGMVASALTGRPLVLEVIGPRQSLLSLRRASRILTYSETMIKKRVPSNKLVIVEAAVDVNLFRPDATQRDEIRSKYDLGDRYRVVGYVGSFAKWHGLETLLQAAKSVVKQYPETRFLMVGPYFRNIQNMAATLDLLPYFIFTGPVDYYEVPKFVNAADILVAPYDPTRSELRNKYGLGSPLKVLEYMACAKPFVSTSIPPITRVLKYNETGILIPPGDANGLAKAILMLMGDRSYTEKIGQRGRKEVVKWYSWDIYVSELESIFQDLILSTKDSSTRTISSSPNWL